MSEYIINSVRFDEKMIILLLLILIISGRLCVPFFLFSHRVTLHLRIA